jgi:hypothetical protein
MAISKPMKLIALRIGEEEKARLEQLAEEKDVTLSRALREGAALYLGGLHGRLHEGRGGATTLHGVRRGKDGRPKNPSTAATPGERARVRRLRRALYDRGLQSIRSSWDEGEKPAIVLAAVGQWLSLVGELYGSNPGEPGWDWFLRDYCLVYSDTSARVNFRREIRAALVRGTTMNVTSVLDSLEEAFLRLLDDAENQELVRRSILPTWDVMERELSG